MPKPYTFPTLFDEVLQISTTKLKEWGYLNPEQYRNGTINWSINGEKTASISILVDTFGIMPFIKLDYKSNGESINYRVYLTSVPSNLGTGVIWYFLCPHTHKRCRKLYLIGNHFLHRTALPSGMYQSQIKSKHYRSMEKVFSSFFETDELYDELYSKHFKKFYAGKPTKRYLRILKQIQKTERLSSSEIESLILP